MAMKKQNERQDIPINPEDDPAVQAAFGNGGASKRDDVYGRIERARKMTPAQRKRAERDAARSKATFDLPADLLNQLEIMAREVYKCPVSHLVGLLIKQGMRDIDDGRLDVFAYRKPARSLRFDWMLDIENFNSFSPAQNWFTKNKGSK